MKVASTPLTTRKKEAIIPLERPEKKSLEKGQYEQLTLYNNPSTPDTSTTFKIDVPYFGTGTPEEYLLFKKQVDKVIVGQGLD